MAQCSLCGNEYDAAFEVRTADGERYTFDSVECAAHVIAPTCEHCGCRVLGHGVQANSSVFCCANCAREAGKSELRDRM